MDVKEFKIEGMSCNHCVIAVENELREAGYLNFKVEIGTAKVEHSTSEDEGKIISAIIEAGFKVV